jgi:hypothetical protein
MGLRKTLANLMLGQDVDDLCMAWYTAGIEQGFEQGMETTINDVVTDLLSDAVLAIELDTEMMQRIVEIIEN